MTLRRSGDGSVPDDVFNELVEHVEQGGGGGSLPNPIVNPVNIATTDPNDQPLKITLPSGFFDGKFTAFTLVDENGKTLLEVDADGTVTLVPATGQNARVFLINDGSGGFGNGGFTLMSGTDETSDLSLLMAAPTGRNSSVSILDPSSGTGHQFVSGNADTVHAQASITNDADGTVGFFGTFPAARPQVPVIPTPQDIADALIALGLISQAS